MIFSITAKRKKLGGGWLLGWKKRSEMSLKRKKKEAFCTEGDEQTVRVSSYRASIFINGPDIFDSNI